MMKSFVSNSKSGGKPDPLTIGNIFSLIVTCNSHFVEYVDKTFVWHEAIDRIDRTM